MKNAIFGIVMLIFLGCSNRNRSVDTTEVGGLKQNLSTSDIPAAIATKSPAEATADTVSGGAGGIAGPLVQNVPKSSTLPKPKPRIIRSGEIGLRVHSLDSVENLLGTIADANGGYISKSSREQNSRETSAGAIQIRVPSERFDSVVASVRKLGEVAEESISTNDVSAEFIDMQARLKTQQELESRILRLLSERTGRLPDVIDVESKLAEVRNQIEQIQGQLRFTENQASYSTLSVTLSEPGAIGTSERITAGGRIHRAFNEGMDGLVGVAGVLITLCVAFIPILGVALLAYFVALPLIKMWKARTGQSKKSAPAES